MCISDEDIEKETKMHMIELDQQYNSRRANEQNINGNIDGEMERLRIQKKRSADRRKARAENPTNLLFAGDGSDCSSSSDSGGETEEEDCAKKKIKLDNI